MKAIISALLSIGHHLHKLIRKNSIKTIVFVFSVSTHAPKSQAGKNDALHKKYLKYFSFSFLEIDSSFIHHTLPCTSLYQLLIL